jgi:ABC-type oligopeptide transport system substrate-binding subunit
VTEGDPAEEYWAKRPAYMATNGAFAIRSWNRATGEFTLQRNEYYHISQKNVLKGKKSTVVAPSRLTTDWTDDNFYFDYENDMNKFLQTKNDAYYGNLESLAENAIFCVGELPADKELRTMYLKDAIVYDALSTYTYIFNTNKAPFDNANVRLALSMALDRTYLANELVFAKPADGFISPAVWDGASAKTSFRDAAGSLINTSADMKAAEALVADVDKSETIVLTIRNKADEMLIAEYAEQQWEKLGFDVEINAVTFDTEVWATEEDGGRIVEVGSEVTVYDDGIQAAYYSGEFDVLGVDYNMYSTNAFTALCGFTSDFNGNGVNYYFDAQKGESARASVLHCSGYANAEFDRIMKRALAEKNVTRRAGALHAAEAQLLYTMPIMPIVYNQSYYLVSEIKGLDFNGYGNPVFTKASLAVDMPVSAPASSDDEN